MLDMLIDKFGNCLTAENIIKFIFVIICICKPVLAVVHQKQITECPHPDADNKKYEEHSFLLGCNIGRQADRLYHCANAGFHIIELCQKEFECAEGTYLTVSSTGYSLTCSECPKGTFYPSKRPSTKALACRKKSSCDPSHHEEVCDEGSSKEDRTCKCMYRKGYRMLLHSCAEEKCCSRIYCSSCYCEHVECNADKELNSTYHCVPKCQEGYYRPEDTNECILYTVYPKSQFNGTTEKMNIDFTEQSETPVAMTSKLPERVTSKSPVDNRENSLDAGRIDSTEQSKTPVAMTSKLPERVTSKSPVDNRGDSLDAGKIDFTESSKTPEAMTSQLSERVTSKSPVDNRENSLDAGKIVAVNVTIGIFMLLIVVILVAGCWWFKADCK